MTNTIELPYTYEPDDEDLDIEDVIIEVDYTFDWRDDDFYITGFHCKDSPEAAREAARKYDDYKSNWYDIVNEKIKERIYG